MGSGARSKSSAVPPLPEVSEAHLNSFELAQKEREENNEQERRDPFLPDLSNPASKAHEVKYDNSIVPASKQGNLPKIPFTDENWRDAQVALGNNAGIEEVPDFTDSSRGLEEGASVIDKEAPSSDASRAREYAKRLITEQEGRCIQMELDSTGILSLLEDDLTPDERTEKTKKLADLRARVEQTKAFLSKAREALEKI